MMDPAHTRQPSRDTYRMLVMCWTGFTSLGGSPKDSPWYGGRYNAAPQMSLYTCLCEAGSLYPVAGVIAGLERRVL